MKPNAFGMVRTAPGPGHCWAIPGHVHRAFDRRGHSLCFRGGGQTACGRRRNRLDGGSEGGPLQNLMGSVGQKMFDDVSAVAGDMWKASNLDDSRGWLMGPFNSHGVAWLENTLRCCVECHWRDMRAQWAALRTIGLCWGRQQSWGSLMKNWEVIILIWSAIAAIVILFLLLELRLRNFTIFIYRMPGLCDVLLLRGEPDMLHFLHASFSERLLWPDTSRLAMVLCAPIENCEFSRCFCPLGIGVFLTSTSIAVLLFQAGHKTMDHYTRCLAPGGVLQAHRGAPRPRTDRYSWRWSHRLRLLGFASGEEIAPVGLLPLH